MKTACRATLPSRTPGRGYDFSNPNNSGSVDFFKQIAKLRLKPAHRWLKLSRTSAAPTSSAVNNWHGCGDQLATPAENTY